MVWPAIAATVVSGYMSHRASGRAARQAEQGQRAGLRQYQQMYGQARTDLQPYRQAGQRALTALERMAGLQGDFDFTADPGYQFRLDQGQQAVERGAAARGGLLSGGHTRELTEFAQGMASQEYQNAFQRLAGIAGMGQQAAAGSADASMQAGQGMAGLHAGIGQTQAAGTLGQANAIGQTVGQGAMLWGYDQGRQHRSQTQTQDAALGAAIRNPRIMSAWRR